MSAQNQLVHFAVVEGVQHAETTTEEDNILNILGFGVDANSTTKNNNGSKLLRPDVQLPEEFEKYKQELKIIVANGTVKDFIGRHLIYEELNSLSSKQLRKYYQLYTEKKNVMIASPLSDAFVGGITMLVSEVISIDDINSYRNDLNNDFLTSNGINHIVEMVASFIGQPLGLFSASIITVKHMECKSRKQNELSKQNELLT